MHESGGEVTSVRTSVATVEREPFRREPIVCERNGRP